MRIQSYVHGRVRKSLGVVVPKDNLSRPFPNLEAKSVACVRSPTVREGPASNQALPDGRASDTGHIRHHKGVRFEANPSVFHAQPKARPFILSCQTSEAPGSRGANRSGSNQPGLDDNRFGPANPKPYGDFSRTRGRRTLRRAGGESQNSCEWLAAKYHYR